MRRDVLALGADLNYLPLPAVVIQFLKSFKELHHITPRAWQEWHKSMSLSMYDTTAAILVDLDTVCDQSYGTVSASH